MSLDFKAMTEPGNNLLVVDALNLAFRWKHQGATDFVTDYVRTVLSLAKSYKASKIVIAADKGSSKYRKEIYPEYKENRKELRESQTEAEAEYFKLFFEEYERCLDAFRDAEVTVLQFNKTEADDIAAYIVSNYSSDYDHIWLISSDKDWDLLVSDKSSRFSYVTRKETTLDNWGEHYDCTPEQYISLKCLMGDSGDNIQGVKSIGPKRAKELIDKYGSAFDIVDAIPIAGKYVYIKNLNESADLILLNYRLMDLMTFHREALGSENIKTIEEMMQ